MRLLLLGINYAPEPVGIGPYTQGVAEALAAAGWQVDVVTAQPYYPAWRRDPAHARPWWRRERRGDVRIVRCPLYVPRVPSGVRRIVHLASFTLAALGPMILGAFRRPAVVMVVAPSLLSAPVARLAARLARAPLWVHVQDFEVEAALATGLVAPGRLARLALRLENRLLRSAALVSTISPQMVARLKAKGIGADRVLELRNWAGDFTPTPDGAARYRAQWALGERRVALYSGNLANKQGVGLLVEAARLLAHRNDIALVICGEGPSRAALATAATTLPNLQLHPLQPAARMGDLLALAHVHLLPQLPDAADLVLPSKLANMLASGRPVIATAAPGTGIHAAIEGCGIAAAPGDAAALAAAIEVLIDDPTRAAAMGQAAAAAAGQWTAATILPRFVAAAARLAGVSTALPRPTVADTTAGEAEPGVAAGG